jgi:hypothetical protein
MKLDLTNIKEDKFPDWNITGIFGEGILYSKEGKYYDATDFCNCR